MKTPYTIVAVELSDSGYFLGLKPFRPELEKPDRKEAMRSLGAPKEIVEQMDSAISSFQMGISSVFPEEHDHPHPIEASVWIPISSEDYAELKMSPPGTVIALELSLSPEMA